jgi:uncharacterized membrane protein YphA (DoxX/SURF4 family)
VDIVVTVLQVLLAVAFIGSGFMHATRRDQATGQMAWMLAVPKPLLTLIGVLEILGGIGLLAPWFLGIAKFLAPLAAIGLVLVMVGAAVFHLRRSENAAIGFNVLLGVIAAVVAFGRIDALHF